MFLQLPVSGSQVEGNLVRSLSRRNLTRRGLLKQFSAACLLVWTSGCGYHIGNGFDQEIRSVHVPIFTSDLFRRDVNLELTEAVQREIMSRTPFKLSTADRADTRLIGHVVEIRKDVLGETQFDDPRQLQLGIALEILWEENGTGNLLVRQQLGIDASARQLLTQANFAPELGQSYATAKHEAITRLARRVVDLMEAPW